MIRLPYDQITSSVTASLEPPGGAEGLETAIDAYAVSQHPSLPEIAGLVDMGKAVSFYSDGRWSQHDLLTWLLKVTGPACVHIVSWAMTEQPVRQLLNLKNAGQITHLAGVFNPRVEHRNPNAYQLATTTFDSLQFYESHSKLLIIENDTWALAVVSSQNFSNNPRLETGVIMGDRATAIFYRNLLTTKIK
ncbi:hypothetical protein [Siphonobacter sp. SORGH_AS_0500]|uniref:hypothetical protein n=1 Tax=Siphonobacter sp. SORGH_AS_0500 TaxID=1864824 RepID=UPI0028679C43|nr:hypothetical protein [Siphonobacter sp. SORGH_AS_0500]MDR6196157.1 hypothetical protein [Siphonobacter sp. SORGH_AS_0500]